MTEPHILLVDDSPVQAEARQAVLRCSGAQVSVASSARAALKLLADNDFRQTIGLMVTDHLMPGMNGPELVEHLRQILPALPILVLSGLPDAEAEYPHSSIVFRLKPFPPQELIRLARHMLGDRALRSA
jgi:CheY-like chemotaxis protein